MKRLQKGFSLIELMIVIAIIGILAAIAIPSYQTYVKKAKVSQAVQALEYYKPMIADAYEETGSFPSNLNSTLTFYNYVDLEGWTMMWQNAAGGLVSSDNAPKASLEIDLPADLGSGVLVLAVKAEEGGLIFRCGYWDEGFASDSLPYTPNACLNTDLHDW